MKSGAETSAVNGYMVALSKFLRQWGKGRICRIRKKQRLGIFLFWGAFLSLFSQ